MTFAVSLANKPVRSIERAVRRTKEGKLNGFGVRQKRCRFGERENHVHGQRRLVDMALSIEPEKHEPGPSPSPSGPLVFAIIDWPFACAPTRMGRSLQGEPGGPPEFAAAIRAAG
jgi:hypothetical protein